MTFIRRKIGQAASIGVVIDHHSIVRDNGHFVAWETFEDSIYGTDGGVGVGREKVIPNGCPVVIAYDKKRKADVLISVESLETIDTTIFEVAKIEEATVVAVIGPVLEHAKNNAMNGVGVMRGAGLYENLLHGADKQTGLLPAAIRRNMLAHGFYFAQYRDVRTGF